MLEDKRLDDGTKEGTILLYPIERQALQTVECGSTMIWVWIGSLIGQMAKDEDIPPRNTPTFGRFMSLAAQAHNGIRQTRMSTTVRPPYLYTQMLAVLVHTNNIINAISFGMTSGAAVGVWAMRLRMDVSVTGEKFDGRARFGEVARDS